MEVSPEGHLQLSASPAVAFWYLRVQADAGVEGKLLKPEPCAPVKAKLLSIRGTQVPHPPHRAERPVDTGKEDLALTEGKTSPHLSITRSLKWKENYPLCQRLVCYSIPARSAVCMKRLFSRWAPAASPAEGAIIPRLLPREARSPCKCERCNESLCMKWILLGAQRANILRILLIASS